MAKVEGLRHSLPAPGQASCNINTLIWPHGFLSKIFSCSAIILLFFIVEETLVTRSVVNIYIYIYKQMVKIIGYILQFLLHS